MKNLISIKLMLLLLVAKGFGQVPNWSVNENEYQYTMTFVAFLSVDGHRLNNENDKIAAFVDGVCRGVANLTYVANEDAHYAYLTVFSNNDNETLNFQLYQADDDRIVSIDKTESFAINGHHGDLFQAFSVAQPTLHNEAEIIDFTLDGISIKSQTRKDSKITLFVDQAVDRSALNAVFQLSRGAKLYLNNNHQVSGSNSVDFGNPLEFEVLSEDQSVVKQWTIEVKIASEAFTFFKKDAVCYRGGAIKVTSTQNQTVVTLTGSGNVIAEKTMTNGEVIFTDLEPATYTVQVEGNGKEIDIALKN